MKDGFVIKKPQVVHSRARARAAHDAKVKGRHCGPGTVFLANHHRKRESSKGHCACKKYLCLSFLILPSTMLTDILGNTSAVPGLGWMLRGFTWCRQAPGYQGSSPAIQGSLDAPPAGPAQASEEVQGCQED